jgi:Ni,Fe-hydrogenase I large subunit
MYITANDLDILNQDVAIQSAQLTELAHMLVTQTQFAQFPTWRGQCAENGPWTRLRHRAERAQHSYTPRSVWSRMAARWLDLLEIVHISTSGHGAMPLSSGALELAPGQAIAWCEMARGLLMHWVQVDTSGHVQDYRVLAPTEWNFHPQSALAQAVAVLNPQDHGQAMLLADAFDPCVGCKVEP